MKKDNPANKWPAIFVTPSANKYCEVIFKDIELVISKPIGRYYYTHVLGENFEAMDVLKKWNTSDACHNVGNVKNFIFHIKPEQNKRTPVEKLVEEQDERTLVKKLERIDRDSKGNTGYLILETLIYIVTQGKLAEDTKKHYASLKKMALYGKKKCEKASDKLIKLLKEEDVPQEDLEKLEQEIKVVLTTKTRFSGMLYDLERATMGLYPPTAMPVVQKTAKGEVRISKEQAVMSYGIKKINDLLQKTTDYKPSYKIPNTITKLFERSNIKTPQGKEYDRNAIKAFIKRAG